MDLEAAERNRTLFLAAFLVTIGAIVAARTGLPADVLGAIRLFAVVFAMVTTWRFARSIGMGALATGVNTLLAALIMVVPLFVLLHYHRRYVAEASQPAPA